MINPLDLFKSVKSAAITLAVVAGVVFTGILWIQKINAQKEVAELTTQVTSLKQDVFKEQIRASGYKIVIETLEDTYTKIEKTRRIEAEIEKDITDAPPEDDGEVAPVLRRTIDSVGRMLNNRERPGTGTR